MSLSKVTRVVFQSLLSHFAKSLKSFYGATASTLPSRKILKFWRQHCVLRQKPHQKDKESFNGWNRTSGTIHTQTYMVPLRNFNGWTRQLPCFSFQDCMVRLSSFHPLAQKAYCGHFCQASGDGERPFWEPRTPLLGTANAPSGNRESPFWEQRTVLQGIANAPSGDQGRAALVAASMSSPTTERASWYALEW